MVAFVFASGRVFLELCGAICVFPRSPRGLGRLAVLCPSGKTVGVGLRTCRTCGTPFLVCTESLSRQLPSVGDREYKVSARWTLRSVLLSCGCLPQESGVCVIVVWSSGADLCASLQIGVRGVALGFHYFVLDLNWDVRKGGNWWRSFWRSCGEHWQHRSVGVRRRLYVRRAWAFCASGSWTGSL